MPKTRPNSVPKLNPALPFKFQLLFILKEFIMNKQLSFGKTSCGSTVYHKDKIGRLDFIVRTQAGQEVCFNKKGHRLGYIDALGRTLSTNNKILNSQPRPDMILSQSEYK